NGDSLPEYVWTASIPSSPEPVAERDHGFCRRLVVLRDKRSSKLGMHVQHLKHPGCNRRPGNLFGPLWSDEPVGCPVDLRSHEFKRGALLPPIDKIGRRNAAPLPRLIDALEN